MKVHVVTSGDIPHTGVRPRTAVTLRFIADHFLLVPVAALVALVWANIAPDTYFTFARRSSFAVNEIGMAFFLAYIGQEIWEELMPGGSLHTWRRWMLPVVAAFCGVCASAAAYTLYVTWSFEEVLQLGWPAATAIDVALVYLIARLIFGRHPAVPFVLLMAIASNIVAFAAVAPRPHLIESQPGGAGLIAFGLALAIGLRYLKFKSFTPYLLGAGSLLWLGFYAAGLHPALALLPIVPFLPHQPRGADMFADAPHGAADAPSRAEHLWRYPAQVIVILFALVNAGVALSGYGTGTWALITAAYVGRPIGIMTGIVIGVLLGLRMPARVTFRDEAVLAGTASAGFTMALFFATSAYPIGPILGELKLGALITFGGLLLAVVVAALLGVGRFSGARR